MQRGQVKAAATAGDAQTLAHQANQPIFTQRLPETWSGHQRRSTFLQLAAQLIHHRHIDAWHIGPCQQLLLLTLQLFQQFGAHFAALQYVQQVRNGAEEGQRNGGFAQCPLAMQLLQ
ncbi:hypothetical protein D3C79_985610 [compost metagenome]